MKRCYLCQTQGRPGRRRIHAVRFSFGIGHFTCPVTEDDYERDMLALMVALGTMRALSETDPEQTH